MNRDLPTNLESIMHKKGLSMKSLSLLANLNETAVRDIIKGRVKNPTYLTLEKLAKVLECPVTDLVTLDTNSKVSTKEPIKPLTDLNTELLIKSIIKVDSLIKKNKLQLSIEDRARVYVAWYELTILTKNDHNREQAEAQLATLLKFSRQYK